MTLPRFAVRALALSLTLIAAGAFCVVNPASPASAAGNPIGGRQLAQRGVIVNLGPGVPPPPAMPGASYLIADMDTGQILAAKAPHARFLPASTLKTLTALTLIPHFNVNSKIMVKPLDAAVEGSRLGVVPGVAYPATALLQGLLMTSGNDAAYALARGYKSIPVTLREMNATAAELNAADTIAKDPSGLDRPGQTSSAYDLALIGRAAMKLPDFRKYVRLKQVTLPAGRSADGKPKPGFKIATHNKLLLNYPGTIGIKSGYTIAAKHTFVGAATRRGKTYIVTQMSSPNISWRPTAALLDWAFANGDSVTPIGELVEPGRAALLLPTAKPTVLAAAAQPQPSPAVPVRQSALPLWLGVAGLAGVLAMLRFRSRRSSFRKRNRAGP
jgi:D-alanyl-D-alanine carboxypeptidase (penicillin-binding protein 5/6)